MTVRLLLKKYTNGMMYLCKRKGSRWIQYRGSGVDIPHDAVVDETIVLGEYDSEKKLKPDGVYYSNLWNVVENPLFYNKVIEEGQGGDRSGFIRYPMGVYITCKMCGSTQRVPKSHGNRKYCSNACASNDKEKYKRVSQTLKQTLSKTDLSSKNKKISKTLSGREGANKNKIWFNNGKEEVFILNTESPPPGYKKGKLEGWYGKKES